MPMLELLTKEEDMETRNYIYVHIPKTAGRSILAALGVEFRCEHRTILDYCNRLTEKVVAGRYKFTAVRNPWDRAVSWWLFFGSMDAPQNRKPFEEWVVSQAAWYKKFKKPITRKLPLNQTSFCTNAKGDVLMDQFLQFEKISTDFTAVATQLKTDVTIPWIGRQDKISQVNQLLITTSAVVVDGTVKGTITKPVESKEHLASMAYDYHNAYTCQQSIDAVAEMDADIIGRFGYTFEDGLVIPGGGEVVIGSSGIIKEDGGIITPK